MSVSSVMYYVWCCHSPGWRQQDSIDSTKRGGGYEQGDAESEPSEQTLCEGDSDRGRAQHLANRSNIERVNDL